MVFDFLMFSLVFVVFIAFTVTRKPPNAHGFTYTSQSVYLFKWHPFVHNLPTKTGKRRSQKVWSAQVCAATRELTVCLILFFSCLAIWHCTCHIYIYIVQRPAQGNQIDKYKCVQLIFFLFFVNLLGICFIYQSLLYVNKCGIVSMNVRIIVRLYGCLTGNCICVCVILMMSAYNYSHGKFVCNRSRNTLFCHVSERWMPQKLVYRI